MLEQSRGDTLSINYDIEPSLADAGDRLKDLKTSSGSISKEKRRLGHKILDLVDNGVGKTQAAREYGVNRVAFNNWLLYDRELAIRYNDITTSKIELVFDSVFTEDLTILEALESNKLASSIFWHKLRGPQFEAKYQEIRACLVEKICNAIEAGTPVKQAVKDQGIAYVTFKKWLQDATLMQSYQDEIEVKIDWDWAEHAKCKNEDVNTFFPAPGQSMVKAKNICKTCSVKQECLEYALSSDDIMYGIWGGTNHRQRRQLRRLRKKKSYKNLE